MSRFGNWVDKLFEKHKFARRVAIFWIMLLISWCTVVVYSDLSLVNSAIVALYGTTVGMLGTIVGMYMHSRNKRDGDS